MSIWRDCIKVRAYREWIIVCTCMKPDNSLCYSLKDVKTVMKFNNIQFNRANVNIINFDYNIYKEGTYSKPTRWSRKKHDWTNRKKKKIHKNKFQKYFTDMFFRTTHHSLRIFFILIYVSCLFFRNYQSCLDYSI